MTRATGSDLLFLSREKGEETPLRASQIIRGFCGKSLDQFHAARVAALLHVVDAVGNAGRLTLTSLARALRPTTTPKHRIKRVDRLLGNFRLQLELNDWYALLAQKLLKGQRRPLIALDWTQVSGDLWALWAAIPFKGRGIPLYVEVHSKSKVGNRKVQTQFLESLREILPADTRPILVADAGFRTPFFYACFEYRFDFVIRLRGNGMMRDRFRTRHLFKRIFRTARSRPRSLGDFNVHDSNCRGAGVRVVLGSRPAKLKKRRDTYRRSAAEPWLLATSMIDVMPSSIVGIYATRMQIEETFRDAKNPRAAGLSPRLRLVVRAGAKYFCSSHVSQSSPPCFSARPSRAPAMPATFRQILALLVAYSPFFSSELSLFANLSQFASPIFSSKPLEDLPSIYSYARRSTSGTTRLSSEIRGDPSGGDRYRVHCFRCFSRNAVARFSTVKT
jgi:hypothetical protein